MTSLRAIVAWFFAAALYATAADNWKPFEPVTRPQVPTVSNTSWCRNPIDNFIAKEHEARNLKPRPEASKQILLRRVYLDLIGLVPTPDELHAFENDPSPDAYEKAVDRLLNDPRYGERWARHWMDIWRYSDWAGYNQEVRDSQPFIWRWRDWIVESLNDDKGYDKMVVEMLAADELSPKDTNALRATGFLVRNFKSLSREQWLTDTVHHTAKAFLGLTMNCAKCHDHKYDPISQKDYYAMRAVFEPYDIRTDRLPGNFDTNKNGLVRVYDVASNQPTYLLIRGDERTPDTNQVIEAGTPKFLGGTLDIKPVSLPRYSPYNDPREPIIAADKAVAEAKATFEKDKVGKSPSEKQYRRAKLKLSVAEAKHDALLATLKVEQLDEAGQKVSEERNAAATNAVVAQRKAALLDAQLAVELAREKQDQARIKVRNAEDAVAEAEKANKDSNAVVTLQITLEKADKDYYEAKIDTDKSRKALTAAQKDSAAPLDTNYKPSTPQSYPRVSTGRRSAFARWIANEKNPLTARVAMNHIWLRHFGEGIVSTPSDFGRNGHPPSNPQLLDWLAAEFMSRHWSMKEMHRLIVTSSTYRMASTFDKQDDQIDSQNVYLWRMPTKRMEAELVRDNLLYVGGNLDLTRGGPDIAAGEGLKSKRRSLYLRTAAEKEVEFLKIFDSADVTECYARKQTVMPHQALALANSPLSFAQSKALARKLSAKAHDQKDFIQLAFEQVLSRAATKQEVKTCSEFLDKQSKWLAKSPKMADTGKQRAREDLVLVFFNHNDFVSIR